MEVDSYQKCYCLSYAICHEPESVHKLLYYQAFFARESLETGNPQLSFALHLFAALIFYMGLHATDINLN